MIFYYDKIIKMIYLAVLPIELRSELLKYFHPCIFISETEIKKLRTWDGKQYYIFQLDCFKCCDNEQLWEFLYMNEYSNNKPSNISYKDAYIKHKNNQIKKQTAYLSYEVENGLEKNISAIVDNIEDYFDYSFLELLKISAKYFHINIVKNLLFILETVKGYNELLLTILSSPLLLDNLSKASIIVDLLLEKIIFPKLSYNNENIYILQYDLKYYFCREKAVDFIQFLIKYNAIAEQQIFLEYLCGIDQISSNTIKWCLE